MSLVAALKKVFRLEPSDYVLVIGAAHVDVLADYETSDQDKLDKVGTIRFSVGGTAYNIAVNLGQVGIPVEFITVLRNNSFPTAWISQRLESASVSMRYVEYVTGVPDSGFVAIRCGRELENAVTASAIGSRPISSKTADTAIERSRMVVLDCNLPTHELSQLLEKAHFHRKPTVVAVVSDSKVGRLLEREHPEYPIDLVSLNNRELAAIRPGLAVPQSDVDATAICDLLSANTVILTLGEKGHLVLTRNRPPMAFRAPNVKKVVSSTGAGDALVSGVLTYWYRKQQLDFTDMASTVETAVSKVLDQEGATVGALASEADFSAIMRTARRKESIFSKLFSAEVGVLAGILLAILAALDHCSHHEPESRLPAAQPQHSNPVSAPVAVPATKPTAEYPNK